MNTTTEQIAENVRKALEDKGYKAKDLAAKINISYAQATRLLAGKSRIRYSYLSVISKWLGVDVRHLIGLPVTPSETWLTVRESAAKAKRHPETIRKAIHAGELESTQRVPGGMHLIRESDLDAWIAGVR